MRRRWAALLLVAVAVLIARDLLLRSVTGPDIDADEPIDRSGVPALEALARAIRPLHRPKTPPQPGEWLDRHQEVGQTFEAYLAERPNRRTARRTTLYLRSIGEPTPAEAALLARTADLLGRFYGLPVKRLDPIDPASLPAEARLGDQWITGPLLDRLIRERPDDAVAVLALTTADLTPGESWNYVFGQATLDERVGVWSSHRFGDPATEPAVVLRRTLQTAVHETGHMLGIRHCTAYECGMNGSNHLAEADGRPMGFCPECEMKVWWACGVEPRGRYRRLAEFAEDQGLGSEAASWAASARALDGAGPPR